MGVYSTIMISREDAIKEIVELLETATNDEVGSALFALTCEHKFDNYHVVNDVSIHNWGVVRLDKNGEKIWFRYDMTKEQAEKLAAEYNEETGRKTWWAEEDFWGDL